MHQYMVPSEDIDKIVTLVVKMVHSKMSAFSWLNTSQLLADILLYTIFTTRITDIILDVFQVIKMQSSLLSTRIYNTLGIGVQI